MSKNKRPLIVVSNDDGYDYPGIAVLTRIARRFGDVVVVAPQTHQSGRANAISISNPVRVVRHSVEPGFEHFVINGTPTDCCKLALGTLLQDREVDLVLSGINHGANAGVGALYSGTLGVAMEGCLHGIPSIGFSYTDWAEGADFTPAEPYIEDVIRLVLSYGLPEHTYLNVNIPKCDHIRGIRVARMGMGRWENEHEAAQDSFGGTVYWLSGNYKSSEDVEPLSSDTQCLKEGYVAITPMRIDLTDEAALDWLRGIAKI